MSIPVRGQPAHSDHGKLENVGCCITTIDSDRNSDHTAQKDSENDVWKMYLNEIEADDKRMIDAWKQDAKGVLVFVSPQTTDSDLRVRLNDNKSPRQVFSPQPLAHLSLNSTKS